MTRNDTARLIEPARSALVPSLSDSAREAANKEYDYLPSHQLVDQPRRRSLVKHHPGCWTHGPSHYECALRHVMELKEMLQMQKARSEGQDPDESRGRVDVERGKAWLHRV